MLRNSVKLPQGPAFARSTQFNVFVSTYQLEGSGSRSGSIYILSHNLDIVRCIVVPAGVFRFEFVDSHIVVAAVTDGSLFITTFNDLPSSHSFAITGDLLLDVSSPSLSNNVVSTDSTGHAYLIDLATGTKISNWKAHSLPYSDVGCEVWTCALNGNLVCTGGEDSTLKVWDIRDRTVVQQYNEFTAGVTFSGWEGDHFLITGSYDKHIRLFDMRSSREPTKVSKTPGGVWHIENCEHIRSQARHYIAACMYGGWGLFDKNFELSLANEMAGEHLVYGVTMISENEIVYTSFNNCVIMTVTL